jgi:hypothetical protein
MEKNNAKDISMEVELNQSEQQEDVYAIESSSIASSKLNEISTSSNTHLQSKSHALQENASYDEKLENRYQELQEMLRIFQNAADNKHHPTTVNTTVFIGSDSKSAGRQAIP